MVKAIMDKENNKKTTKKTKIKKQKIQLSNIDYLKNQFPKKEGEISSSYNHLWGNNYRINFYSEKDIRSYFVQIIEDKNGFLSHKIF